jgi:GDP-4-dehydro-6-deoxy-D-mannose reductase
MRALITGAGGFVGRHLIALAADRYAELFGIGRGEEEPPGLSAYRHVDLTDPAATQEVVAEARPDAVFHLAAVASVAQSWNATRETLDTNLATTLNLLEAIRSSAPEATTVVVGSGEQYGPVDPGRLPVDEEQPMRPQSPYAVSKAAAELVAGFYADVYGLRVIRARSFNHAGPGQTDRYVVASFAKQIAAAERAGDRAVVISTGDLAPRRDFSDVRDVARAYLLLAEHGTAGIFNVCSGVSVPVADILAALTALTDVEVEQRTDPARLRKHEVMDIRGSHARLTEATGWEPEIPLEQTLSDTLDWWRAHG